LRRAEDADLVAIAAIGDEHERQGWPLQRLREGVASGLLRVVVEDGSFAIGQAVAGEAHILDVRVRPDRRRQGLGRRLVEALVLACDAELALLEVRQDNHAAIGLYTALGFEVVGRREAYYADGVDALLMSRGQSR